MKVGVVGLGLIGGSMAKAVKKKTEHTVLGWDVSETIRYSALLMEAVHGFMEDGNPKDCDLVLLGLYPHLTVTPYKGTDLGLMNALSMFFKKLGFARLKFTTTEEHDAMIAYTSQLAHVVSSAYVKGALSDNFKDFSGGSFQDMTRVARLNENMWTELFLDNGDNLANEIDSLIARMQAYSTAIKAKDADTLCELLREGREKCIAIDEIKDFD